MRLGELIQRYINEHGSNYRSFGKQCGISAGYISMLVNNMNPKSNKPPIPTLSTYSNIANAMGMTLNELFSKIDDAPVSLSAIDTNMYDGIQSATTTKRIPILGDTAAGAPIIANREYDEYIEVPTDGRKFDAAVRVKGDSMAPAYNIGDLALVRYQDDVLDGQIAVICLDDEVTFKRLYHLPNGLMLHSDNPKYKPMMVSSDDVPNIHLTGRVVGCIRWEG